MRIRVGDDESRETINPGTIRPSSLKAIIPVDPSIRSRKSDFSDSGKSTTSGSRFLDLATLPMMLTTMDGKSLVVHLREQDRKRAVVH
jgi:hypothetical protein